MEFQGWSRRRVRSDQVQKLYTVLYLPHPQHPAEKMDVKRGTQVKNTAETYSSRNGVRGKKCDSLRGTETSVGKPSQNGSDAVYTEFSIYSLASSSCS